MGTVLLEVPSFRREAESKVSSLRDFDGSYGIFSPFFFLIIKCLGHDPS